MVEKKVLLISVGGSPEPIALSLKKNNCPYVIFFCSTGSYNLPKEVIRSIEEEYKPDDYVRIVTDNHEDIDLCYKTLEKELPKMLNYWNMGMNDIVVDYTGGTKTMSVALVLATVKECSQYTYIGGKLREKDGLGIVRSGSEVVYPSNNPWRALGVQESTLIDLMFDRYQFQSASDSLRQISNDIDPRLKETLLKLSNIALGYYQWDSFMHNKAHTQFKRNIIELKKLKLVNNIYFIQMIEDLEKDEAWLGAFVSLADETSNKQKKKKSNSRKKENSSTTTGKERSIEEKKTLLNSYKLVDLLSNSKRRAEKEHRYDDAVARLYSCLEKYVKFKLLEYGIDNSKAKVEDIPENLRPQFEMNLFKDEATGEPFYKFGLVKTCEVLSSYDPSFAKRFEGLRNELNDIIYRRNASILAHGEDPVKGEDFSKLLEITLTFTEINEDELISFPSLNFSKWCTRILS